MQFKARLRGLLDVYGAPTTMKKPTAASLASLIDPAFDQLAAEEVAVPPLLSAKAQKYWLRLLDDDGRRKGRMARPFFVWRPSCVARCLLVAALLLLLSSHPLSLTQPFAAAEEGRRDEAREERDIGKKEGKNGSSVSRVASQLHGEVHEALDSFLSCPELLHPASCTGTNRNESFHAFFWVRG